MTFEEKAVAMDKCCVYVALSVELCIIRVETIFLFFCVSLNLMIASSAVSQPYNLDKIHPCHSTCDVLHGH